MAIDTADVARFIGGGAQMWNFMPSHDHLAIKLSPPEGEDEFLVLSGCAELMLPVGWKVIRPAVIRLSPPWLEFVDERVRVRCQDISLHKTYKRP